MVHLVCGCLLTAAIFIFWPFSTTTLPPGVLTLCVALPSLFTCFEGVKIFGDFVSVFASSLLAGESLAGAAGEAFKTGPAIFEVCALPFASECKCKCEYVSFVHHKCITITLYLMDISCASDC